MGPERQAMLFKTAYRFTVLLALGASAGCLSGSSPESSVPNSTAWTTKTSMPTPRTALAVGVVGNILYAVGGSTLSNTPVHLSTVQAYDPSTNAWTTVSPMPTKRSGLAVGVVNGILYALGGTSDGVNNLTTVEKYDPGTDSWTAVAPMSTARYGLGVGVVNGQIYAVGGFIAPDQSSPVEAYDPGTDTWTPKAPMPTGRMLLGVGVVNNILYAVGGSTNGSNNLPTVEAYDPVADAWNTNWNPIKAFALMPTPRGGLAVGVNDGILYAVGGQLPDVQPGDTVPKTLEAYNPAMDI